MLTWKNVNEINLSFLRLDSTNSKKEEDGPAHLDPSTLILSAAAPAPSSATAAMGMASTAAFPSATTITSAGTASASSVSAPLGAGSTAPTASEEMVSAVHAGASVRKRFSTCGYTGYSELFSHG